LPAEDGVTLWFPLSCCVPLHAPLAAQDEAFVEDQLKVKGCPTKTADELEEICAVGAGGLVTVRVADALALPPAPVQAKV